MATQNSLVRINRNDSDVSFRDKVNKNFMALLDSTRALSQSDVEQTVKNVVNTLDSSIYDTIFDLVCPVGTIIWTNTQSDPRLGRGRWQQLQGVFLIAAGSGYESGDSGGGTTVEVETEITKEPFRLTTDVSAEEYELVTDVEIAATVEGQLVPWASRYCYERIA